MIDSPYLVKPGKKAHLTRQSTDDTGDFKSKSDAQPEVDERIAKLDELQQVLYAEGKRSLLVVFQAMDGGGKDSAIRLIFSGVNPQGCQVTSFKAPTHIELAHDYLWRIHLAAPARGMIGIFNRSHYESLLVERVQKLVPESVWSKRFDHINNFEQMLVDEGTTILKFHLHISKAEQRQRMEDRVSDPEKNWKFDPNDLRQREKWDEYQEAYEDVLTRTSTRHAPWYVVPSDKKWFRNWVISDVIVRTLKKLDPKYPAPAKGLDKIVVK